jgi:hypothetical protein
VVPGVAAAGGGEEYGDEGRDEGERVSAESGTHADVISGRLR